MAPRVNAAGLTWKQFVGPVLKLAIRQAAKRWKPKGCRCNHTKVKRLREQRAKINGQIKAEVQKG